jgi:hypothetical protein
LYQLEGQYKAEGKSFSKRDYGYELEAYLDFRFPSNMDLMELPSMQGGLYENQTLKMQQLQLLYNPTFNLMRRG